MAEPQPGRPLSGSAREVSLRLAPFALVATVVLLSALIGPDGVPLNEMLPAIALQVILVAVSLAFTRLPQSPGWVQILPALGFFVVVYVADVGQDGPRRGLAALALLPVVWVALYGTARQLLVTVAGVAVVFTAEIVFVGEPQFSGADWHRVIALTFVGGLVGYVVHTLVASLRAAQERDRQHLDDLRAVTNLTRDITGDDARERLCAAACLVSGGSGATIGEFGEGGKLHFRAQVGIAGLPMDFPLDLSRHTSGAGRVLATGRRYFAPDCANDAMASPRLVELTRASSGLWEPIVERGKVTGVLGVWWREPVASMSDRKVAIIGLLAREAGHLIDRADLVARLEHQSRTDVLTGLANRRVWNEFMARECAVSARTHEPLTVAMVDLDRFKAYNDQYGHQTGDVLLASCADAWTTTLRDVDLLARMGGEEFAVALPGCDLDDALVIVDRLRGLTPDGQTCSAGVAQWREGESVEGLLRRADTALYAAKDAGRACTRLAA
ncbi:MAG: diguanylate cyclase [Solirubrobacteraceae bacterium]|nr:diguanylate cyclase [Solirubrobacteraceae bacterium]